MIAYDGTKIGEINTAVLRGGISYVTQETFLFHDTVAENLKVAKEDATEEELERAARAASIHDLIMSLPDGYETKIAELGSVSELRAPFCTMQTSCSSMNRLATLTA